MYEFYFSLPQKPRDRYADRRVKVEFLCARENCMPLVGLSQDTIIELARAGFVIIKQKKSAAPTV